MRSRIRLSAFLEGAPALAAAGLLSVLFLLFPGPAPAGDCAETVTIGGNDYAVPAHWCGKRLDSTRIAVDTELVRLPDEFTYEDYRIYLRPDARDAFVSMARAAKGDSVQLLTDSGYRSLKFQERIILERLRGGQTIEHILSMVAPPGYSEHHTGRAVDLVPSEALFAGTAGFTWLAEHAAGFGFRQTFPESATDSLHWESWHWYYQPDSE